MAQPAERDVSMRPRRKMVATLRESSERFLRASTFEKPAKVSTVCCRLLLARDGSPKYGGDSSSSRPGPSHNYQDVEAFSPGLWCARIGALIEAARASNLTVPLVKPSRNR